MKRSEMVEIINNTLHNSHPIGMSDHESLAEEILSNIEGNGMSPPSHTYWKKGKEGNILPNVRNGDQVNEWEPE